MYGYPANATIQWAHSYLDAEQLAVIAAPTAAAIVLLLLAVATATCSVYWLRRWSMSLHNTHRQVEYPGVPKDKTQLIPWFTDADTGDWV